MLQKECCGIMKNRLRLLCEAFIQAKHKIGRTFTDSDEIDALCANILITRGLAADKDALLRCRSILCTRAALFSALCGVMGSPVSCLMYAADDPVKLFTKLVDVHTVLKRYFADSPYLVYASAVLTEFPDEMNEGIAIRARNIYELMKLTHPGITSSEDQVFCVLFAASGRDADTLLYETEYIQKTLDTGASNTW